MSSRIRRNILIFTIWYIRIRFSEITTRLRRIFRWGKIDRRKQLLLPSAPDLPYNKALPELYDSAKFPEKSSAAGTFCLSGVKKVPTRFVSISGRDGGAGGGTRTHTPLRITDFESVSSANSDTPANIFLSLTPDEASEKSEVHRGGTLKIWFLFSCQFPLKNQGFRPMW